MSHVCRGYTPQGSVPASLTQSRQLSQRGYTQAARSLRERPHPMYSRLHAVKGLAGALVSAAQQGDVRADWTHAFVSGVLKLNNTWDLAVNPLDLLVNANNSATDFDLSRDFLSRSLNLLDPPQANTPSIDLLETNTAVCTRYLQEIATGPMDFEQTRAFYSSFG